MTFTSISTVCPTCKKHLYITADDQKTVSCANCGDDWKVTLSLNHKVKLSKINRVEEKSPWEKFSRPNRDSNQYEP